MPPTSHLRTLTLFALLATSACASSLLTRSDEDDPWLREMGFMDRADWSSTMLHRDRSQLPGTARLSIILDQVPGLRVGRPLGDGWGVVRTLPEGGRCELAVYVNGTQVSRARAIGVLHLDMLAPPRDLVGVEVHFGADGPVFDPTECGTLLLWSRRDILVDDGPFRGRVVGTFWGDGAETVTEVALRPGSHIGSWDPDGGFSFPDVLPGSYEVVVLGPEGEMARERTRVYAYANSRVDVALDEWADVAPRPSSWLGCYAFTTLAWSRALAADEARLHAPPDTFRLHGQRGTQGMERGGLLARPPMPPPPWSAPPAAATWSELGTDTVSVAWSNGFTGALLIMGRGREGIGGHVPWVTDVAADHPYPEGRATLSEVECPGRLPETPSPLPGRSGGTG